MLGLNLVQLCISSPSHCCQGSLLLELLIEQADGACLLGFAKALREPLGDAGAVARASSGRP